MEKSLKQSGFIERLATFIVEKRKIIFVLYIAAIVFCMFSMNWVQVENDVTKYLPDSTETRLGIEAMNENFAAIATARVMVSNVTYETAENLSQQMVAVEGVAMVTFDASADHYRDATALLDITFADSPTDPKTLASLGEVRQLVAAYDACIDTSIGQDMNAMLDEEMLVILIVASIIILVVLALTSRTYAEIFVLIITFGVAALLNMGTNFIFESISFISDSVAVVLQLALAIDYAIILCHRFTDEKENLDAKDAAIAALSKAMPEISASSLTTVSGLAALGFMKFGIGLDMAMVLVKSILLSLLSVFTLMPGLLVLFSPLMDKTRHKRLLPNITFLGKFAVKTRRVVPFLFILVLIGGCILSSLCPYTYSFTDIRTAKMTAEQEAYFQIKDKFGNSNMVAVLIPSGDYEAESKILAELSACPEVKNTMGLAGIEAMGGYKLTDALTPRELSELMELDYELAQALYTAYATQENQYGQILNGLENYKVPLFDMILFLKDGLQSYNVNLELEGMEDMGDMFAQLEMAQTQMQTEKYTRMVVYLNLPEESQETYDFLAKMRQIIGQYYESDYYLVGNSTSSRDLASSFEGDNLLISVLSVVFVIIVLLFTFQSAGMPVLLILVIQGSIWINFSFPVLLDQPLYFLGYMIVNAIMMGANIDYAIVISSHYQELKEHMPHKQAIVHALNAAFPTVFTSGIIMSSAALLIGQMTAQPVISIMGNTLGRGTIISIILVLVVLPSILVLGDSIIERTKFKVKPIAPVTRQASGTMIVKGRVRGYISGMVDAEFDGVLHGQLNASVATIEEQKEEEQDV